MKNTLIIGDVHGKINQYWKILQSHKGNSIQVGDFGFREHHKWHLENINGSKHKILFGNHDDYRFLYSKHSLGDCSFDKESSVFTVRGANSIDKHKRIEGVDWFRKEELSYTEFNSILSSYELKKPEVVISHDCPQSIRENLFNIQDKSITSNGLQAMFNIHKPKTWIFGHHHKSIDTTIKGTRFICLKELETILI